MTKREFFTAISTNLTIPDELRIYATEAIEKMDEANAKRSSQPTKAQKENAPIVTAIKSKLSESAMTANQLAAALVDEFPDIAAPKIRGVIRQMEGVVEALPEKVKEGKSKVLMYRLAEGV